MLRDLNLCWSKWLDHAKNFAMTYPRPCTDTLTAAGFLRSRTDQVETKEIQDRVDIAYDPSA